MSRWIAWRVRIFNRDPTGFDRLFLVARRVFRKDSSNGIINRTVCATCLNEEQWRRSFDMKFDRMLCECAAVERQGRMQILCNFSQKSNAECEKRTFSFNLILRLRLFHAVCISISISYQTANPSNARNNNCRHSYMVPTAHCCYHSFIWWPIHTFTTLCFAFGYLFFVIAIFLSFDLVISIVLFLSFRSQRMLFNFFFRTCIHSRLARRCTGFWTRDYIYLYSLNAVYWHSSLAHCTTKSWYILSFFFFRIKPAIFCCCCFQYCIQQMVCACQCLKTNAGWHSCRIWDQKVELYIKSTVYLRLRVVGDIEGRQQRDRDGDM